jgi:hypothetical protein
MVKLKILILEVLLHLNEILQKSIFVCGEMKILPYFQGIGKVGSIELNEDLFLLGLSLLKGPNNVICVFFIGGVFLICQK